MYLPARSSDDDRLQTLSCHNSNLSDISYYNSFNIKLVDLCKLICSLHDMGKASEYWIAEFEAKRHGYPHAYASARWLYKKYGQSLNPFERMTAYISAFVILCHHGGLRDCITPTGNVLDFDKIPSDIHGEKEYNDTVSRFFSECANTDEINTLFYTATDEVKQLVKAVNMCCSQYNRKTIEYNNCYYFTLGMAARYIYAVLIDSDRYDAACFNFEIPLILFKSNKVLWNNLLIILERKLAGMPSYPAINIQRQEISDSCKKFAQNESGIYRLYVPTGGGKTLSSLRYALTHAEKYDKAHIIYVVPYKTIIEQNAREIRDNLECGDDILLEYHSDIIRDNDDEERLIYTERWNTPIIFTTLVQLLDTLFSGRASAARRMTALSNSVIIFDEIQAIPSKCIHMFNSAIRFLNEICGSTVVLCTATQPRLTGLQYTIMQNEPADIIPDYEEKFLSFRRTVIIDKTQKKLSIPETMYFAYELLKIRSSLLIVVNTKKEALKLYIELKSKNTDDYKLYHLSTSMCAAHRFKIIDDIINNLGKEKLICVSTQLIECGVNISFDCAIRCLAGLDNIAQTAGRCNRHGIDGMREVYIIEIENENLGSLKEIETAGRMTKKLLIEYSNNPVDFNNDLLSPASIKKYFDLYYNEIKNCMSYNVNDNDLNCHTTIYELLGSNEKIINNYKRSTDKKYDNVILRQAFKTSVEYFQVIDSDTTGVIVPYGDGKAIIDGLLSAASKKEKYKLIQKAQRYTVNMFYNNFRELTKKNALHLICDTGVYILQKEYYSDKYGVYGDGVIDPDSNIL